MDNHHDEKENTDRRNNNTEYLPTKCRITRPPPPKPATNPLQFIKVAPCALFRKAQEQIKKVEEIKSTRQEIREDAEDWQQNLDNWKSSRRKRQEHIIERVVEVKKFEQEEHGRGRRKSKTFSEMIEERSKGRHKFNIPIYTDDDSNDLSDYGIGSNSSKTNSVKDVDTDDSGSMLGENCCDSPTPKRESSVSCNQSQSENTLNNLSTSNDEDEVKPVINNTSPPLTSSPSTALTSTYTTNLYTTLSNKPQNSSLKLPESKLYASVEEKKPDTKVYTYEGAIQDYRARMKSKVNLDELNNKLSSQDSPSKSKEYIEAQVLVPKGQIFKRKELFEVEKPVEISHYETNTSRRLTEDFINAQSIKQRLKSLEKCREQMLKNEEDKCEFTAGTVRDRLQNFHKRNEADSKNNNNYHCIFSSKSIGSYLLEKSNSNSDFDMKLDRTTLDWKPKDEISDRSSSPEAEIYMNKLNMFNRDLDNLMYNKLPHNSDNCLDDYYPSLNYPASTSSMDLMGASSDREDSGIHTADVSCSVSQADEPVEDPDIASTMIPNCIEKLKNESKKGVKNDPADDSKETYDDEDEEGVKGKVHENGESLDGKRGEEEKRVESPVQPENVVDLEEIISATEDFLNSARKDSSSNLEASAMDVIGDAGKKREETVVIVPSDESRTMIYENVKIKPIALAESAVPIDSITIDLFSNPPKAVEPPKVKPPPPPPPDDDGSPAKSQIKRLNSTKRIKKELHIKRSSFLGLQEPTDDQIDPDIPIDRPPDINVFLQSESKLEKSLYKKMQESQEGELSKVESQDSGLDIERGGRLSSDTWCSSIGDSSHGRQDSEPTNSTISEEDEITKKEREIIEMVEKEEKSRDNPDFPGQIRDERVYDNALGVENGKDSFSLNQCNDLDDIHDSEVLKVEHQLLQLEKEELERQHENLLFRESCAKAKLQNNRHSLENICENMDIFPQYDGTNYRKSMPELQIISNDCCKSALSAPNNYYNMAPHLDLMYSRKSVPENDLCRSFDHRKSMPELQQEVQRMPFHPSSAINRQPIPPGKPLRPLFKDHKDRDPDAPAKQTRQISRHSLQALSAVPRQRHVPNDNWIQPRAHNETKSYNQHWLFHEAELRRLSSDQQKNLPGHNHNWLQSRQDKHIPDSVIQTLTQRVQNRTNFNDRNPAFKRSENNAKDYIQRPYMGNKQTVGHAAPMSYPPPIVLEDSQDRVLSVSGKKKCSYCGNELGRGAAMIIESLCLFYHMECFKCCVCHMQLGDGMMGTDVRVRNQKLHCHNCYSSDDGVKFSCV